MKNGTETASYGILKARLPKISEIESTGCKGSYGSCPAWMVNGLIANTKYYPEGTKEDIDYIWGYWSLSSPAYSSDHARFVDYSGLVMSHYVSNTYGLRPVITVSKSDFS